MGKRATSPNFWGANAKRPNGQDLNASYSWTGWYFGTCSFDKTRHTSSSGPHFKVCGKAHCSCQVCSAGRWDASQVSQSDQKLTFAGPTGDRGWFDLVQFGRRFGRVSRRFTGAQGLLCQEGHGDDPQEDVCFVDTSRLDAGQRADTGMGHQREPTVFLHVLSQEPSGCSDKSQPPCRSFEFLWFKVAIQKDGLQDHFITQGSRGSPCHVPGKEEAQTGTSAYCCCGKGAGDYLHEQYKSSAFSNFRSSFVLYFCCCEMVRFCKTWEPLDRQIRRSSAGRGRDI